MNKELINKYKKEFDHYLKGGDLLCYTEVGGPYYKVTDEKWDFACDIGFIVNDAFVEFRKALTECKTVQYNFHSHDSNFPNVWRDVDLNIDFVGLPHEYRIKPDRFKDKTWVKENGDYFYVHSYDQVNNIYWCRGEDNDNYNRHLTNGIEWTPQPNGYIWNTFWGLLKVISFNNGIVFGGIVHGLGDNPGTVEVDIKTCEPYIGPLPMHLSGKEC